MDDPRRRRGTEFSVRIGVCSGSVSRSGPSGGPSGLGRGGRRNESVSTPVECDETGASVSEKVRSDTNDASSDTPGGWSTTARVDDAVAGEAVETVSEWSDRVSADVSVRDDRGFHESEPVPVSRAAATGRTHSERGMVRRSVSDWNLWRSSVGSMHERFEKRCGVWVLSVGLLILGGCSFQSSLSGAECDRNGQREEGRVCENGYWVSADAGTTVDASAPESCNGMDDDGDDVVDEGCDCDYEENRTGVCEGGGVVDESGTCRKPEDWIRDEGRFGGCGDGLDNDCDGETDENCRCEPGTTRPCYSGDRATNGVGACEPGTEQCTSTGQWGSCSGDVTPVEETSVACPNGVDDDCDGVVDEGCPCDVNDSMPGGTEGVCSDAILDEDRNCPAPEGYIDPTDDESASDACDGRDNDCDGATDEGCACTFDPNEPSKIDTDWSHSTGVCTGRLRGPDGTCRRPNAFARRTDREMCDGEDNDCDGLVDEGCDCSGEGQGTERDCYSGPEGTAGEGPCEVGTQTCTSSNGNLTWGATCDGQTTPEPETCSGNDVDKNCSGVSNDGCPCNYSETDRGVCGGQVRDDEGDCTEPVDYVDDEQGRPNCDGKDNDCDGATDEGCPCNFDGNPEGVCGEGTRTDGGSCAEPDDFLMPGKDETGQWCDGRDNDCDGETDEDGCNCVNGTSRDCYTGPADKAGVGICTFGKQVCEQGEWGECQDDVLPGSEQSGCSSDQKDNDCDGVTDENCTCTFEGRDESICAGQTRDDQGICQEPSAYEAPEQSCENDGVDNDCDGRTDFEDEDCKRPPGATCAGDHQCRSVCKGFDTGTGTERRCVHRIFVTSEVWTGDLGGVSGADAKCNRLASQANLGGTWRALLSSSSGDASGRISMQARLYNLNGDEIASDPSDLWDGTVENSVVKDETNNDQKTDVWTGSNQSGEGTGSTCNDWSSGQLSEAGTVGDSEANGEAWIDRDNVVCDTEAALYCVNGP